MDVPQRGGRTWYTKFRNWPWIIALVALLTISLWFGEIKPRRATNDGVSDPGL
jgi:apolipoprotein N-acyltransferase